MSYYYKRTAVEAVSFDEIANEAIRKGAKKNFVWRGAIFTRTGDATFRINCSDGKRHYVGPDDVVVFEATGIEVYSAGVFEELYEPAITDETNH